MKEVCVLVVLARGGEGAVTDVPLKKHESRLELINKISPNVQSRHNIWMVRKLPVILSNFLVLIDKKRTQIRFTRAFKFTVGRIKLIESAEQYNSGCSMVWNYQILPISHESCTHQMLWYFNVHATLLSCSCQTSFPSSSSLEREDIGGIAFATAYRAAWEVWGMEWWQYFKQRKISRIWTSEL